MRVRPWLCISTMATAALCTAASFAGGSNCCVPNGGLGCDDPTCQDAVCAADSFCCTVQWDLLCASQAASLCPDLCGGGGGASNCCVPNGGLGCDDPTCQDAVCAADSFCCTVQWDALCASQAASLCPDLCGGGGGGNCGTGGDCCTASGGIGCNDVACCEAVCASDSFCCSVQWDSLCASTAQGICFELCGAECDLTCPSGAISEAEACGDDTNGGCNAPPISGSTCCVANGGLGCDDVTCQDAVCAADSFCCTVSWDSLCASQAASLCGDLCASASAYEAIACGDTICGTFWADGSFRDTDWYSFSLESATTVTWSVKSAIPTTIAFLDNNCPPFIFAIATASGCPHELSFCLDAGTYTAFVAPGLFNGIPCGSGEANNYVATLTCGDVCEPLGCGSTSAGDCCVAGAAPYCNDADCCNAVCAADVFCCSVAWDAVCAQSAAILCLDLCGPDCDLTCPSGSATEAEGCGEDTNGGCNAPPVSGSTCCIANGGLGCDDITCQDAVCGSDPFCCSVQWDGLCASMAASLCGDLCSSAAAYEAIACGTTVCGTFWADGSFRDTDWYSFTLTETTDVTWSVKSVVPTTIALLDSNCPPFIYIITTATGCPHEVNFCLDAGTYTAFVAPGVFNGLPCGSGEANNYVATLTCAGSCEPLGCGSSANDCCSANGTPFCSDEECCTTVCSVDSFCCSVAWDSLCADQAAQLCTACQFEAPANDECAGAIALTNGGNAVSTQGATGQTDLPAECVSFTSVSIFNEVWYSYTATGTSTTFSTCNSATFDTRLAVFSGSCADPVFVGCNDDGAGCAGFTSELTVNTTCGETYFVVVGAFTAGVTGTGTLTVTPAGDCPTACLGDLDGDGDVDSADLALLLGGWNGPGASDLDGNGTTDSSDLAILLGAWGSCP